MGRDDWAYTNIDKRLAEIVDELVLTVKDDVGLPKYTSRADFTKHALKDLIQKERDAYEEERRQR
jgi:Arc/MetJ-type ribon-helix-helix transcriptional regulator